MKEAKIEKFVLNLSTRWDCSPQEAVDRLNHMNESEINKLVNSMTKKSQMGEPPYKNKFENGGIMKCLQGGKTYAECKKCGGKTPVQNVGLGDILGRIFGKGKPAQTREPGTRPSSAGIFQPNYVKRDDALWFDNNGARVRNHFVGNTLTQAFTTTGDYGKPILQYRIVENYDMPMPGDTSYVNGYGSRNVSEEYKRAVDRRLQGAEPEARSASEVRAINRSNKTGVSAKKCGGPLPKKSKFKK